MTTTTRTPDRQADAHSTIPSAAPAATIAPQETEVSVATYDIDTPAAAAAAAPLYYEESAEDYEYATPAVPGSNASFTEEWSYKIAEFVREDPKRGLAIAIASGFVVGKLIKWLK